MKQVFRTNGFQTFRNQAKQNEFNPPYCKPHNANAVKYEDITFRLNFSCLTLTD